MKSPRTVPGWFALAIVFVAVTVPVYADAASDATALFYQASAAANNADLNQGERNSLVTKVIGVMAAVERGNDNAARGSLGSFVNHVDSLQQSGRLDDETAQALLDAARNIESQLGN